MWIKRFSFLTILMVFLSCAGKEDKKLDVRIGKSLQIFQSLQKSMQKELLAGVKEGGFKKAINVCNQKAANLEKMAGNEKVQIKRVSDKPRNPDHAANAQELIVLNKWHKQLAQKQKLTPESFTDAEGNFHVMKPITIQKATCLNCHGSEDSIQAEVLQEINRLYPDDKAKGYQMNQLRGAFLATWKKE